MSASQPASKAGLNGFMVTLTVTVRPLTLSLVCCRSTNGQENLKIRSSLHWENLTRQGDTHSISTNLGPSASECPQRRGVDNATSHDRRGDLHTPQVCRVRGTSLPSAGTASGSASSSAMSPRLPTPSVGSPSMEALKASATVIACSWCQGLR